jgi:hypothetical protein
LKITEKIKWVLFGNTRTSYSISQDAGVSLSTLQLMRSKERDYQNMTLKNAQKLENYYDDFKYGGEFTDYSKMAKSLKRDREDGISEVYGYYFNYDGFEVYQAYMPIILDPSLNLYEYNTRRRGLREVYDGVRQLPIDRLIKFAESMAENKRT